MDSRGKSVHVEKIIFSEDINPHTTHPKILFDRYVAFMGDYLLVSGEDEDEEPTMYNTRIVEELYHVGTLKQSRNMRFG